MANTEMMTEKQKHPGATGNREYPIVLIIDRDIDPRAMVKVWFKINEQEMNADINDVLHWTDTCGSRAVWYFSSGGYEKAEDLPQGLFDIIEQMVDVWRRGGEKCSICLRREDPGLGIYIPELDDAVKAAGEAPDGCIAMDSPEGAAVMKIATEMKRDALNRQHLENSLKEGEE